MPDFERKNSEDAKSKSTVWDSKKQQGTIENYFLWSDMKPDHRKKIAHYQTLKYPIKSDEGQDFVTFVQDPEQINQYVRNYGIPAYSTFSPSGRL